MYAETNNWLETDFDNAAVGPAVGKCQDGAATMVGLFFSEQLDDIATAKAICHTCVLQGAASTVRLPGASRGACGAVSCSLTARFWPSSANGGDPERTNRFR